MKALIFKAIVMVVIMVGISNYIMYLMTGQSPFTISKPNLSISAPDISKALPGKQDTVYKWKDAEGKIHYSSEPPESQNDVDILNINPDTNLVQGTELKSNTDSADTDTDEGEKSNQPQMPTGNVYNPETIKKLFDDAKGVQDTLNKRYEDIEKR